MFWTMQFRPRCNINEWIMFPSTDFQYLMNAYWMCYTNVVENHCCWQGIWKDAREIRKTFNLNLNWEVWNGYFSYSNSPGCKFRYITYLTLICSYKTWLRPVIWKINYLNHRNHWQCLFLYWSLRMTTRKSSAWIEETSQHYLHI